MMEYNESIQPITQTIQQYFQGIFKGDVELLRSVFAQHAYLWGDVKGAPYQKSLEEYLDGVKHRKSPSEMGEPFASKILGLEIWGKVATARLHVPMLGYNYYDVLALARLDQEWKIVNKLFVHVE